MDHPPTGKENAALREEIDGLIAAGNAIAASHALADLWRREPTPSSAAYLIRQFELLRANLPLASCSVAILRSFTVEPVVPLLRAAAFAAGIDLTVHLGDFNAYAQEMLDPASSLYRFAPDVVILAAQSYRSEDLSAWIQVFRGHSSARLILHTVESPAVPRRGVLDSQIEASEWTAVQDLNRAIRALAREHPGVYVLDYDALTARHGRTQWRDERKWLTMRMPIAAGCLIHLANDWMRFLHPLTGRIAKVAAVDLDNTLWGGVIGEDGMEGVRIGAEYPGAAYLAVQRALLDFRERGILLAVCSKNNPDEALAALESHPEMLLRPHHFSAMRINWQSKAGNLREIAEELNVGLDSVTFIDDNPVERGEVRRHAPEVIVIELPASPMDYAQTLRDSPYFERLSLSAEDARRSEYYAAEKDRKQLQGAATSPEEFYRSLEQEVEVAAVTPMTLARVAQLTQKTNQFNLTTRRYSEPELTEKMSLPGHRIYSLRVKDRFADNGLVGVAILRDDGCICEIDTLLLSCRVIGRTVETAFLSRLADLARDRRVQRLEGWFLPTRKNAPAGDFYSRHGFHLIGSDGEATRWSLDLSSPIPCPDWIRLL
ncbi:MAG: HAD-IIIC family phosphatase [Bryobacteraceae bacterium]